MSMTVSALSNLIQPIATELGLTLWGLEWMQEGKRSVLRIYIDKVEGEITLEDCSRVSRQVSIALDVENAISEKYYLEVSSPGLDRTLFTPEHYRQFIGRNIKVWRKMPDGKRRKYIARLESVMDTGIEIDIQDGPLTLEFSEIQRAKLVAFVELVESKT